MTNKQRQIKLDEEKWLESESSGVDKSGDMPYCEFCGYQTPSGNCDILQEIREKACLCAKAYNKSKKNKSGN